MSAYEEHAEDSTAVSLQSLWYHVDSLRTVMTHCHSYSLVDLGGHEVLATPSVMLDVLLFRPFKTRPWEHGQSNSAWNGLCHVLIVGIERCVGLETLSIS